MALPDLDLLRTLSEAAAPTGEEAAVAAILRRVFGEWGLPVEADRAGNLWATVRGTTQGARSAAVLAHMDEVGLIVRRVERDGFVRVARMGGIGRRSLAARPITFLGEKGPVPALLGVKAHHLTDPGEVLNLPPVEQGYADLGADSAAAVRALGIDIGTKATYDAPFRPLAGGRVSGKAMDNRSLVFAMLAIGRALIERPPAGDVHLVGTVREEFDLRGSLAVVSRLKPDLALVLDVSPAGDTPDLAGANETRIGGGPVVKHYDFHGRGPLSGYIAPKALTRRLHAVADAAGIPTQREAMVGLVTDAAELSTLPDAPVVACLSVPCRYTHSPVELIDLGDLDRLVTLSDAVLRTLPAEDALFAPPW